MANNILNPFSGLPEDENDDALPLFDFGQPIIFGQPPKAVFTDEINYGDESSQQPFSTIPQPSPGQIEAARRNVEGILDLGRNVDVDLQPEDEQKQPTRGIASVSQPLKQKPKEITREFPSGFGIIREPSSFPDSSISSEQPAPELKKEESLLDLVKRGQKYRQQSELLANLGKAFERIAGGISGMVPGGTVIKPSGDEFYNSLIEQAKRAEEGTLDEYKARKTMEEEAKTKALSDPNSPESKMAQSIVKQMDIKGLEGASAQTIAKYLPTATNLASSREAREARKEEARQRELDRQALLKKGYSEKQEKAISSARDEVKTKGYKNAFDMYKNAERISNTFENLTPDMYGDSIRTLQASKLFQGDSSVVRGPELKEVQNAVGVLDKLKNEVSRLGGTAKLQKAQRKQILNAVNTIKNVAKREYTGLLLPAAKQFNRRGLPLEEIFDARVLPEVQEALGEKESLGMGSEVKPEDKKQQIKLPQKYNPGSKITTKQGKIYIVDLSGDTATEQ